MLELVRAGNKERKVLFGASVWKLKKPTFQIPLKSDIFNPTIIDKFGDMHIDWTKGSSMLKNITAPTIFGTTIYNFQQN